MKRFNLLIVQREFRMCLTSSAIVIYVKQFLLKIKYELFNIAISSRRNVKKISNIGYQLLYSNFRIIVFFLIAFIFIFRDKSSIRLLNDLKSKQFTGI